MTMGSLLLMTGTSKESPEVSCLDSIIKCHSCLSNRHLESQGQIRMTTFNEQHCVLMTVSKDGPPLIGSDALVI